MMTMVYVGSTEIVEGSTLSTNMLPLVRNNVESELVQSVILTLMIHIITMAQ